MADSHAALFLLSALLFLSEGCSVPNDDVIHDRSDQFTEFVARHGQPDRTVSTEYDVPRPPIPSRIIEYRAVNVKVIFVPVAKIYEPPPFAAWRLVGFIDSKNRPLSVEAALSRLQKRKVGRPNQ